MLHAEDEMEMRATERYKTLGSMTGMPVDMMTADKHVEFMVMLAGHHSKLQILRKLNFLT